MWDVGCGMRDARCGMRDARFRNPHLIPRILLLTLAFLAGCSPWSTSPNGKSLLQSAKMSPDSVVVEFALLELGDLEKGLTSDLWREADEQQIQTELRRKLAQNGIRCGVLGSQLPSWITDRLADRGKLLQLDESDHTAVVSDLLTQRRIQFRANQHRSIPVGLKCKELELDGPDSEELTKYADAQCHLSITAIPKGDGRVALELVPDIQHGPPRHRWVGGDGLFRLDASRDSVRFDDLKVSATLVPGQTLILQTLPGASGVGKAFAGNKNSGPATPHGKMVLLRLAQTQFDDLFDPQQTLTPIATQAP